MCYALDENHIFENQSFNELRILESSISFNKQGTESQKSHQAYKLAEIYPQNKIETEGSCFRNLISIRCD